MDRSVILSTKGREYANKWPSYGNNVLGYNYHVCYSKLLNYNNYSALQAQLDSLIFSF